MSMVKNVNIEFIRVMAVIAVILIHMSMNNFYDSSLMHGDKIAWVFNQVYYTLTRFCVPVFFIISAYLAFNGKSKKKLTERLIRISLPFLTWSAVYYLAYGGNDVLDFFTKILTSNTSFHLWFFPPFIGYTLFLPVIISIFTIENKEKFKYIFFIVFLLSIVIPSIVTGLNYFVGESYYIFGINNFNLTLPAFLIYGFAFPYFYKKVNVLKLSGVYFLIIILNLIINILVSNELGVPNESFYDFKSILVFVSSFILFNVIMSVDFSFLSIFFCKSIYIIGECSFGIYLSHWLIFLLLNKYGFIFYGNAIVAPVINTVVVFLASTVFVFTVRTIKPLRYFL